MKLLSNFGRVAVLMGGNSCERDVSLRSGEAILESLLSSGVDAFGLDIHGSLMPALMSTSFDRAFIAVHGGDGENGTLQAVLHAMNKPYTGSGVLASALCMDKIRAKNQCQAQTILTPKACHLSSTTLWADMLDYLGGCVIVKPIDGGSSVGMSKVTHVSEFEKAYNKAIQYHPIVMAEQFIVGRELTLSIVGGQILPIIQPFTSHEFYDFDAKYTVSDTRFVEVDDLSVVQADRLTRMALDAFNGLGCKDWARMDVIQDKKDDFWFLEMNTVPGMTQQSLLPRAARLAGISFDQLVLRVLQGAYVD